MKSVHIIGVPLDLGAGRRGVDNAGAARRTKEYIRDIVKVCQKGY